MTEITCARLKQVHDFMPKIYIYIHTHTHTRARARGVEGLIYKCKFAKENHDIANCDEIDIFCARRQNQQFSLATAFSSLSNTYHARICNVIRYR